MSVADNLREPTSGEMLDYIYCEKVTPCTNVCKALPIQNIELK